MGLIIAVMSCSPSCSCVTTFRRNSPVRAVMSVSHWRTRDLELVVLFLSRSFHLDKMIFQMSLDVPTKQQVFKVSCYFRVSSKRFNWMIWPLSHVWHSLDCGCLALPWVVIVHSCSSPAMVFSRHSTFFGTDISSRGLGQEEKGDLGPIFSAL